MTHQTLALVGAVGGAGTTRTAVECGGLLARDGLVEGLELVERLGPLDLDASPELLAQTQCLKRAELRVRQQRRPAGPPDDALLVGVT